MWKRAVLAVACLLCGACAGTKIKPVEPGSRDCGLRFFRPTPYLWVEAAGAKGDSIGCSIVYLPNFKHEYALDTKRGFGSDKINIRLIDGWQLTELGEERETTAAAIPAELLGLIPMLAEKVFALSPPKGEGGGPGLYRFEYDSDGYITGVKRVFPPGPGSESP